MTVLLEGARFHTLDTDYDPARPAGAMAVENGLIKAVGGIEGLRAGFGDADRLDLDGRDVIPAFNDCHCHILSLGQHLRRADLRGCVSTEELASRLTRWSAANPDRAWVEGGAYDQNLLPDGRHLTLEELDRLCPDRPARLYHVSGHLTLINSAAMAAAGIASDTPDPAGGRIFRDESGRATGMLLETAMELAEAAMPSPNEAELTSALLAAGRDMASRGILAATDAWRGRYGMDAEWRASIKALENGCPIRMTVMPECDYSTPLGWLDSGPPSDLPGSHPQLRLGCFKICADGALTSRTAALLEPFEDIGSRGMLIYPPERLKEIIVRAHRSGWQVAVHAIGDRAVALVLEGLETALAEKPRPDARHRIEHCMVINADQVAAMARLGVVAVPQPQFLHSLGGAYRSGLGDRADSMMPYRSWLAAGVRVAFSSDQPVVTGDPITGWRAAVNRCGRDGHAFAPGEALDPITALKCYTVEAAWAGHDEMTGSLTPGRLADFAVLNLPPERIMDPEMKVLATSRDFGIGQGATDII